MAQRSGKRTFTIAARVATFVCLALGSTEAVRAGPPAVLVKDVNTQFDPLSHSAPRELVDVGDNTIAFAGTPGPNSSALWISDGTTPGTVLLDAWRAPQTVSQLTEVAGDVFFICSDEGGATQLRRTVDLNEGTVLASQLDRDVILLGEAANTLYFLASEGEQGLEVWTSDGTPGGTLLVRDIAPGMRTRLTFESRHNAVALGDSLLFTVNDVTHGTELWRSDGTPEGTAIVLDIWTGSRGSNPNAMTEIDGNIFFFADSDDGLGLWRSDGTIEGTRLLDTIRQFPNNGLPQRLVHASGRLFFVSLQELWTSGLDMQTAFPLTMGVPRVGEVRGQEPAATSEVVIFNANHEASGIGREPWLSDGTAEGTQLLKDINPEGSSHPDSFTTVAGDVFFLAREETHGEELWVTDGATGGTNLVKDVRPGPIGSNALNLFGGESALFFAADDGVHGSELWTSDGTAEGTSMVADLNPFPASSLPGLWHVIGDVAVFRADDGVHGAEMWRSDGTEAGTFLLKDIRPGAEGSNPLLEVRLGGQLLFRADDGVHGEELWRTDGTPEGTRLIRDLRPGAAGAETLRPETLGDVALFRANDGVHGPELWRTDGTSAGTRIVRDTIPGQDGGPFRMEVVGQKLYFRLDDGSGVALWQTDGTTEGTLPVFEALGLDPAGRGILRVLEQAGSDTYVAIAEPSGRVDIYAATADSTTTLVGDFEDVGWAASLGDRLIFAASSEGNSVELWVSAGPPATPRQLKVINNSGSNGLFASSIAEINERLVFVADDGATGSELWSTDGTPEGTFSLKDIYPGIDGSNPTVYATIDDTVFFAARDDLHGRELWRTDGTREGTALLRDIVPGPRGWSTLDVATIDDRILFSVRGDRFQDGDPDRVEIWRSNGTESGTALVASVPYVGVPVTYQPELYLPVLQFTSVGEVVLFTPGNPANGIELWALPKAAVTQPCTGDCNADREVAVDELIAAVSIALGTAMLSECPAADANQDRQSTVDEILLGVEHALRGCD